MQSEEVETLVQEYYVASSSLKSEIWASKFASDANVFEAGLEIGLPDDDARKEFYSNIANRMERLRFTVDFMFTHGHQAEAKWTAHGISRRGNEIFFEGIDHFVFEDSGMIMSLQSFWNMRTLMADLE